MSDWFILRTAGRSTLHLAETLTADGYAVWAPAKTQLIIAPRLKIRRCVKLALLPSFVFARSHHLVDLLQMANMADKPRRDPEGGRHSRPSHRDFRVFHYLDKIPMITDHELDPLRDKEREIVPMRDRPRFDRGQRVRVNSGAFQGLFGKIEHCKSGYALVIFSDWNRPVKIPTFLLAEDQAIIRAPRTARAAA